MQTSQLLGHYLPPIFWESLSTVPQGFVSSPPTSEISGWPDHFIETVPLRCDAFWATPPVVSSLFMLPTTVSTPAERELRYRRFIEDAADRVFSHMSKEGKDRGLIVSPMGLREITEELVRRLFEAWPVAPLFRNLKKKEILLVVQGKENRERWRKRLEALLGLDRILGAEEQDHWEKNGVKIHLASIHELSRLDRPNLRTLMKRVALIILDKEHHIRPLMDDPSGPDRTRFIRVLTEGGFLSREFEPRPVHGKFLLGLTESVTEGAGRIYGGGEGLIFAETLPSLLARGFVKRPEVRVIYPKGFPSNLSIHEAWASLDLKERVRQTVEIVDALIHERSDSSRLPRTVVYAGSREEATELADHLERYRPEFEKKVALMISGDPTPEGQLLEARRMEDLKDFQRGLKRIAIHVETMVEGVDEFQRDPVDIVIFSGVERGGGLRYALQSVGAHLVSGEKAPLMIDQAGLFWRHPDLTAFDPRIYVLEEGRLKRGSPLERDRRPRERGRAPLRDVDILTIDIFEDEVGRDLAEALSRISTNISRTALALRLGWSEEMIDQLWSGRFVPNSRLLIEQVVQALGLPQEAGEHLLTAWAEDRIRHYEERHPIPEGLSEGEKRLLHKARRGLILHYGGNPRAVAGADAKTVRNYLESGKLPDKPRHRLRFLWVLVSVIGGPAGPEKGKEVVERCLGLEGYALPRPVVVDRPALLASFQTAIAQAEKEGAILTSLEAADRAHAIYCRDLPEEERPIWSRFRYHAYEDPEITALLEASSNFVQKQKRIRLDRDRALTSFREAISQAEKEDTILTPTDVADQAHESYCRDLPEEERPSRNTFRQLARIDPAIIAVLEASEKVEKAKYTVLHRDRIVASFREAVAQAEKDGVLVSFQPTADRAHEIYCRDLPEEDRPSRSAFHHLSREDLEIISILQASDLVRKKLKLDRGLVLQAFREAIAGAVTEGLALNQQDVADRAHAIYCQDLGEEDRPRQESFRSLASKYPEFKALLKASDVVQKLRHIQRDRTRTLASFREAIAQAEKDGVVVSFQAIADRAREVYCQDLPEEDRPSPGTFYNSVIKDPEITALLEASDCVQKRKVVKQDRSRVLTSFREAIAQAEKDATILSPQAVAHRAHEIYGRDSPEEKQMSPGTFRMLVCKDTEIIALLEASGFIQKRKLVARDPERTLTSFREAIMGAEREGTILTPHEAAQLAYTIYCRSLPEDERPSQDGFRQVPYHDAEIRELLSKSPVVKGRGK